MSEQQPLNLTRETLPFRASDHAQDGKKHILLAATGSVATIKIPQILSALNSSSSSSCSNVSVRLLLTPSARHFLQGQSAEQPDLGTLFAQSPLSLQFILMPTNGLPHGSEALRFCTSSSGNGLISCSWRRCRRRA